MMIYDIFFFVFSLIYLPYLIIKGKAHEDFGQRFGRLPDAFKDVGRSKPVWIHAVSVGEVTAVKNFIESFSKKFPGRKIILSTTTRTGNTIAKKILNRDILKFYFPLDFSFVVKRVVGLINPSSFFMMETEIWPNLTLELSRRKIPIILINGRISERSYRGYRKIKFFFGKILKRVSLFCMQTASDAERITALGASASRVLVTGNMKFDVAEAENRLTDFQGPEGGSEPGMIIAGSTHRGEEEIVLEAYKVLAKRFPNLKLLIAPRHIDRADSIKKLVENAGLEGALLSGYKEARELAASGKTVFILNTHGELSRLYSLATIVFMGGSLIKRGGHNIVEPARFGKPIIFGPYMFNFRDMARLFLEASAAIKIMHETELFKALENLLEDKEKRDRIGRNARDLIDKNRGAIERNIREAEKILT